MEPLELEDIQSLVRHGYPFFDKAVYRMLSIDSPPAFRRWLATLLASGWIDSAASRGSDQLIRQRDCGVAVALTASGLKMLGLEEDALRTFVSEFQEGMAVPHRARLLGDVGESDPEEWDWGREQNIDVLLMVFAKAWKLDTYIRDIENIEGYPPCLRFEMHGRQRDTEPFGFADGISQPFVEGLDHPEEAGHRTPVKAGEFVLGYLNEFGKRPATPSVAPNKDPNGLLRRLGDTGRADLGRNGTFLVLRQLRQHVERFEKFVDGDQARAARMVGRWRSGAPLVRYRDDPGANHQENDFGYHREDRHGFRCPIGAHIRRANPRDSLSDAAGISPQAAQAMVNQHRIIRRGRVYERDGEKGLLFICLNANIERQFEFVQNSWLMYPEFGGLHDETDPLLGNVRPDGPRAMTIQNPRIGERLTGLDQFVTVKGGGYFFLPGMTALRYLST